MYNCRFNVTNLWLHSSKPWCQRLTELKYVRVGIVVTLKTLISEKFLIPSVDISFVIRDSEVLDETLSVTITSLINDSTDFLTCVCQKRQLTLLVIVKLESIKILVYQPKVIRLLPKLVDHF